MRIIDKNINEQRQGLYRKVNGGNEWRELGEKGKQQVLSDAEILELSELVLKIENHYGFPVDIEWAYENGKFCIVQSRPITTLTSVDISQRASYIFKDKSEYFKLGRCVAPVIELEAWANWGSYAI